MRCVLFFLKRIFSDVDALFSIYQKAGPKIDYMYLTDLPLLYNESLLALCAFQLCASETTPVIDFQK